MIEKCDWSLFFYIEKSRQLVVRTTYKFASSKNNHSCSLVKKLLKHEKVVANNNCFEL